MKACNFFGLLFLVVGFLEFNAPNPDNYIKNFSYFCFIISFILLSVSWGENA